MKSITYNFFFIICLLILPFFTKAQHIKVAPVKNKQQVTVSVDGKLFTVFNFPDSLEKPFLYPVYAPNGEVITRGFPLATRAGDPVDHPHHIGLWLNYENVNGLDFWNNSYAIPADKKNRYGRIKTTRIVNSKSGREGQLTYEANWLDSSGDSLLKELTTFIFLQENNAIIIDRITTLIALKEVSMPDIKDGFLGLRVAHELELPSKEDREYADANGIVTKVNAATDTLASGNYLTGAGKEGNAAWGTRANWCLLYGKKGSDSISIAIIDHPKNVGYPTYWHARGYGLFAANPLGQKVFSNGKETLNFALKKEERTRFRYRIVINAAGTRLTNDNIDKMAAAFAKLY
ncbi:PmoA family protein [Panacibacter sp. DH6]|uniref:PmoA family protein n=1 Tax=Panacibacter microcysteis TaxID=2793269 RepID=A0A931GZ69_9BACT|nr:PmoA family protein [Panacibacter microcysteis]MBG9378061.1 PmoA family protein [Panacibacter microcysteis]